MDWRCSSAAVALLFAVSLPARADFRVEAFSPQGTVKDARQVAARFSAPAVKFGDPRLPEPFDVDCPAPGRARWADGRNWVYDFDQDLPGGVVCRFTVKSAFRSVAGEAVSGDREFRFDTGGPSIRASMPREGAEDIDEDQVFLLKLDAKASEDSIRKHAFCAVEGIAEKMPVVLVTGGERKKILEQRDLLGWEYFRILWKDGRESVAQAKGKALEVEEALLTTLRCQRALPPATQVQLVWGAGIVAASGAPTTQDQTLVFKTRPAFTASFSCERVNAMSACLPITPMALNFTAPIAKGLAEKIVLTGDGGKRKPRLEEGDSVQSVSFPGPFPEHGSFRIELPRDLVDDAGRPLQNASRFPLAVQTADAPPLVKFGSEFGILERSEGGVLPVTIRNVEPELKAAKVALPASGIPGQSKRIDDDGKILAWMKRVEKAMESRGDWDEGAAGAEAGSESGSEGGEPKRKWKENTGDTSVFDHDDPTQSFSVPKPLGAEPFEVVGIPLEKPGFYVVELMSPKLGAALLGDTRPRYVATSALVTNLSVHFKYGRESSLVFVTSLDTAQPVAHAAIRVNDGCTGAEHWHGTTDASGMVRITDPLPQPGYSCDWGEHPLMVSARTADDMTFALTTWSRGIGPEEFHLPVSSWGAADRKVIAHTVFDRSLFRAGETVSMKHFLREHRQVGFGIPDERPVKVLLQHQGSEQTYELPLSWDAEGIAQNSWQIPKDAKLGNYEVALQYEKNRSQRSGSFRVEQYRVPTMRAIVQGPKEPLIDADKARLDLFVSYLSGGPAGNVPVKVRAQLQAKAVSFPGYSSFRFGGEEAREGIDAGGGHGFFYEEGEAQDSTPQAPVQMIPLTLDNDGAARTEVPIASKSVAAQELTAELEYQDANGETLTSSARVPIWPAAVVLGIEPEGWVATKDDLRFKVVALDLHGKPLANQRVSVDAFERITHSYRRRLVGGFYGYDHSVETKRSGEVCAGRTDEHGLLICKADIGKSGQFRLQAVSKDDRGNRALATTDVWIAGDEEWWFEATPSDRMDVLPEKPAYEHGETARFQVRSPFRNATALVTVEREGVMESFVTELSGKEPVIEIPIKDNYAPNVYVSVLAVRGRVGIWRSRLAEFVRWLHLPMRMEGGMPTALVDLSKPAYRMGIAHIDVGWDPYRLGVSVKPSAETFRVRETAKIDVAVTRANGAAIPAQAEIAIAAVDEGLLELKPNESWKLLDAMMETRALEVWTSTAQMQVVGKRHYGRKSGAPGGGGGRAPARELFDTLLYWKARVPLDANGRAHVEFPLNDSLTAFRIVAIANAGDGWFGTGSATIRTTQDLQLVSGLPALVRENDHFNATVMLRNASARSLTAEISGGFTPVDAAKITGSAPNPAPAFSRTALDAQTVKLDAGAAREISWPIAVPVNASALNWDFSTTESGGKATDRLKITQPVIAAYPVRTYQATLTQIDGPYSLPIEQPKDAIPGRGGIHVDLQKQLGDLSGVVEYMSRYPYICYEQQLSQAIALHDDSRWQHLMNLLPSYLDRDGLVKYFPSPWLQGSDTLTAYVLSIAAESGRAIPDDTREKMLRGLDGFVSGRVVRDSALRTADLSVRKLAAISALARHGKATAAMLSSITIEPQLWPTSAVIDWIDILHRQQDVADRGTRLPEALQILRSRLNFQGTTMTFSAEQDDALWWLMISADVNAVRAIPAVMEHRDWREDVPRMVRGAFGRQLRGHWNTTTANAWGTVAIDRFHAAFEGEPVTGATRATLAGQSALAKWTDRITPIDFGWPARPATLDVRHEGGGKPWAMIASRAALPLRAPLFTGYKVKRSVTPVAQKTAGVWNRGDVARVHLDLEAQSDMTWVVVDDPIPAGASVQGSGLGGSSQLLTQGEQRAGDAWLAYEERRYDAFRSYFVFVPKGTWSVEYTVRFNAAGTFELPATRVEAMYAPEMFGELPNAPMQVRAP